MTENRQNNKGNAAKIGTYLVDNIVTLIFVVFVIFGFIVAQELTFTSYLGNIIDRFFRNAILVLSLIIPVIAGLGLNFGIVVGAMSGQLALIIVSYFGMAGLGGLLMAILVSTPIAILFGYLTGLLYNKTRGQEMIASLIVGYFGNGIYQFILLFLVGTVIPVSASNPLIMPDTGVGVRMSVDLGTMKYSLDNIVKVPFMYVILVIAVAFLLYFVLHNRTKAKKKAGQMAKWKWWLGIAISLAIALYSVFCIATNNILMTVKKVPVATMIPIFLVCLFTWWIMRTKLGQDFRSVGQNQHIAESNGINVDKTRIIATIISTVLGAWGILIYLENMGTLNTYTTHVQIGLLSVAAILVGGATVAKAGISNVFVGVFLFHSMVIMSTEIGKSVFGGSIALGEYFRTTLMYAVIAISLGLYAIKINRSKKIMLPGATSKLPNEKK